MNRMRGLAVGLGVATLIVVGLACGGGKDDPPASPNNEPSSLSPTDQGKSELSRQTLERALIGQKPVGSQPAPHELGADHLKAALVDGLRHPELEAPVEELRAELAAKEADTFAGLWIEWKPKFRVVAQFTRDGDETIRPYIENTPFVDAVEVRILRRTLVDLDDAHDAAKRAVSGLGFLFNSGPNVKENRVDVLLFSADPGEVERALVEANIKLADFVKMIRIGAPVSSPAQGQAGPSGSPRSNTSPGIPGGTPLAPLASFTYEGAVYYQTPLGTDDAAKLNEYDLDELDESTVGRTLNGLNIYKLKDGEEGYLYTLQPGQSFLNEDGTTITFEAEWIRWSASE